MGHFGHKITIVDHHPHFASTIDTVFDTLWLFYPLGISSCALLLHFNADKYLTPTRKQTPWLEEAMQNQVNLGANNANQAEFRTELI